MKIWRIIDVLQEATTFLINKGIEDARLNAERLMGHLLNLSRIDLYVQFEKPMTQAERDAYKILLKRRAEREPLQYILGETEFMSLSFKVTPDVLIPRPETEVLVEIVIDFIKDKSFRILDIGTGSGCIPVSLAHYLKDIQITAWDVSKKALEVAAGNAQQNKVSERIRFEQTDILNFNPDGQKYDVIISNPPYILEKDWDGLQPEIQNHEPKIALSDGGDGLTFYRKISKVAPSMLKAGGQLFFEIGDSQSESVCQILEDNGFININMTSDLNNIPRVIQGEKYEKEKS